MSDYYDSINFDAARKHALQKLAETKTGVSIYRRLYGLVREYRVVSLTEKLSPAEWTWMQDFILREPR